MIRFGMTLMEMIGQLTKGYVKATGKQPDNLARIKIRQEALKRLEDQKKVVDMEGKPIDVSKGIMGGKQIQDSPEFGKKIKETYDEAKGPGKGQEMVDALKSPGAEKSYKIIEDQLGVKLYGDETFDEILKIQKTGKHPRGEPKADLPPFLKDRTIEDILDSAIDNVSPGFANDLKVDATLVAEDVAEKLGLKYDDLPIREQVKIYGKSYDALAKKRFDEKGMSDKEFLDRLDEIQKDVDQKNKLKDFDPKDRDPNAKGGRIGLKTGMTRRAFLALMGSIGAGIGAAKSGLLSLTGKQAAKEVAKQTVVPSSPPPYFFELAEKIKKYGKPSKVQPQERMNEYSYVGKNGDEYTMTEDITSGDIEIIKDKTGVASYGEKTFDTINNRSVMQYKSGKGMADEGTKGTPADEYDEYEVVFDRDGTMADADDMAEQIKKEIIEEAKTDVPPIKKAGGGLAYMLGE